MSISSHGAMRRNGVRFALFAVGERGHQPLLLRLSILLRNALALCGPLITPGKCWRKITWPEFQPSLPRGQQQQGATYLFETNRHQPYSTRRLRQMVKQYAMRAGITKRVYPHLFRHQLMTYLTKQGMISPKLQLLSGHAVEQSLAVYRALALSDVVDDYEAAMQHFPVR